MSNGLIEFSISNFRGIVSLHAQPNGKSVTLKGKNGAGKSSAIDALWWGVGGQLDGEVVRNGAEKTEVNVCLNGYQVSRVMAKGKTPRLVVKSADGKATFNSPTSLLSEFVAAIERESFTHKKPKDQAAILRKLAPEIDTTKLDAEHAKLFAERTGINRDQKALQAQADGMIVPEAPASVPDDVDLVAIVDKKTAAERVRADNERIRAGSRAADKHAQTAIERRDEAMAILENAKKALANAEAVVRETHKTAVDLQQKVMTLADPDTSMIDEEIRNAQITNDTRAKLRRQVETAKFAKEQREHLVKQATAKKEAADRITKRLAAITETKVKQLAAAKLPIDGLSINDDTVTLDVNEAGPVEIQALNTSARIRLDVAIAAALGLRLVAVRDASLLDSEEMARLDTFAAEHGVQLLKEVVANGEPLTAEIVEAE